MGHCVDLGEQFHSVSYWNWLPYDWNKVYDWAMRGLEKPNWLLLVAEDQPNQEIFGYFVAQVNRFYFCDRLVSEEEQLFLHPEKRGGPTAAKFMIAWEKWALDQGAELLFFSPTAIDRGNKFDAFMKKLGYHQAGPAYRKSIGA